MWSIQSFLSSILIVTAIATVNAVSTDEQPTNLKRLANAAARTSVSLTTEPFVTIATHAWLRVARDAPETVVTTIVTAHTTIFSTVVEGYETNGGWTSAVVISGHGTTTHPIQSDGHSTVDSSTTTSLTDATTKSAVKTSISTITKNDSPTLPTSPLVPLPTYVNPSKLSSMLNSLLTDTKSWFTPPSTLTATGTVTKPPQTVTTNVAAGANAISSDVTLILPALLTLLAGCCMLALSL